MLAWVVTLAGGIRSAAFSLYGVVQVEDPKSAILSISGPPIGARGRLDLSVQLSQEAKCRLRKAWYWGIGQDPKVQKVDAVQRRSFRGSRDSFLSDRVTIDICINSINCSCLTKFVSDARLPV